MDRKQFNIAEAIYPITQEDKIKDLLSDPESKKLIIQMLENEKVELRLKELENLVAQKRRELDNLVVEFRTLSHKCPHTKIKPIVHDRPEGHEHVCLTCHRNI